MIVPSYACDAYGMIFFLNDTATTEIYTLSLHGALPILLRNDEFGYWTITVERPLLDESGNPVVDRKGKPKPDPDRKSTRLNSSHANISYAVFCLKKKNLMSYRISTLLTPHLAHTHYTIP